MTYDVELPPDDPDAAQVFHDVAVRVHAKACRLRRRSSPYGGRSEAFGLGQRRCSKIALTFNPVRDRNIASGVAGRQADHVNGGSARAEVRWSRIHREARARRRDSSGATTRCRRNPTRRPPAGRALRRRRLRNRRTSPIRHRSRRRRFACRSVTSTSSARPLPRAYGENATRFPGRRKANESIARVSTPAEIVAGPARRRHPGQPNVHRPDRGHEHHDEHRVRGPGPYARRRSAERRGKLPDGAPLLIGTDQEYGVVTRLSRCGAAAERDRPRRPRTIRR